MVNCCPQASPHSAGGGGSLPGDMEVPGRGLARRVVRPAVSMWNPHAASSADAVTGSPVAAVR